jgi:hypothetical protein
MHVILGSSIVLLTGWGLLSFLRWRAATRDGLSERSFERRHPHGADEGGP